MRRLLLLPLAALVLAPASAGAQQLQPSDLPDIPILDPSDLPDVPFPLEPSDLPDVPAAAKRPTATFKVSLYGVQRYSSNSKKAILYPDQCWADAGTASSSSLVRFSTKRPARATVTKMPGGLALIDFKGDREIPLPVKASFQHRGSSKMTMIDCLNITAGRQALPEPEARNCSDTLDNIGFDLQFTGPGVLKASSQESLVVPLVKPFEGCPWGERSGQLYSAEQRISIRDLMRSEEMEVVLRMRERDELEGYEGITGETRRQTTIYVVFKRVGR
ncbi:MAG TPA: hypothetical protein VIL49_17925 [Capillimicrobium sp.]|jgi:hypothetical protein